MLASKNILVVPSQDPTIRAKLRRRRGGAGFALEAFEGLAVAGHFIGKKLESNAAAKAGVLCPVNHSHTATAEFFQDAIVRDCLANHEMRSPSVGSAMLRQQTGQVKRGRGEETELIPVPEAVEAAAELAIGERLGVVHAVLDRLERAEIGEDGFEVGVRHVAKMLPGHDVIERADATDLASADGLKKHFFVVMNDAGRIGREIGAGHLAPGAVKHQAAGKVETGEGLEEFISGRVTAAAIGEGVDEVVAALTDCLGLGGSLVDARVGLVEAQPGDGLTPHGGKHGASAKRSRSSLLSVSVGSIIMAPLTMVGKYIVGGW